MALPNAGVYPYGSDRGYTVKGQPRGASVVYHQQWVNPATSALNNIRTSLLGPNTATFTLTPNSATALDGTLASGPAGGKKVIQDFSRNVVITVTHASAVVALSGVITGKDAYGRDISEAWSVTAGTTSKTFTGKKGFKEITQVTIVAAADATADTVTIGNGNVLALDVNNVVGVTGGALKELSGGALVVTGVLTAKSAVATDDPRGTYLPAAAPNGATTYDVVFVSDDPENS